MKPVKKTRFSKIVASVVLSMSILLSSSAALAQEPYQQHIYWAANDSGYPNCPERYLAVPVLSDCFVLGNRSCVTSVAIEAAYRHQDQMALWLMAEITQCHNDGARASLYSAGVQAVGEELRR
jgi:hypothetical protein